MGIPENVSENHDDESEKWTKWIGSCVAVATVLVAIVSFSYKELIAPNTAPVNIELNMSVNPKATAPLHVSQIGLDPQKRAGRFAAVYLHLKATNASNKHLKLVKPFWVVFGRHKAPTTATVTSNTFVAPLKLIREFNQSLGNPFLSDVVRVEIEANAYNIHPQGSNKVSISDRKLVEEQTRELIAAGELVSRREIKPREKLETQRVVFVNLESGYDFIETRIFLPTLIEKEDEIRPREYLFSSFLDRQRDGAFESWDWQDSSKTGIVASKTDPGDKLALVYFSNNWCERPISEQLKSYTRNLATLINLFEMDVFHERKKGRFLEGHYCPSKFDERMSIQKKGVYLSSSQMREAGVQFFTATSEVLLLK
jgi:hypothetical protein